MLDLRLNLSSGDINEVLSMRELVKVAEHLDRLNVTFEIMKGATDNSYIVRSYDREAIFITCMQGAMTMTSKARGTYEARTARGVINELNRVYSAIIQPKVETVDDSTKHAKSTDILVDYFKANDFKVSTDYFCNDSIECVYVTAMLADMVVVCVADAFTYQVEILTLDEYNDEEHVSEYKEYKHQARAVGYIRDFLNHFKKVI